jgi:hypothetical protein
VLLETPEGRRIRGRSRRRLQDNIKVELKKEDRRTRDGLIWFWTERSSVLVYTGKRDMVFVKCGKFLD